MKRILLVIVVLAVSHLTALTLFNLTMVEPIYQWQYELQEEADTPQLNNLEVALANEPILTPELVADLAALFDIDINWYAYDDSDIPSDLAQLKSEFVDQREIVDIYGIATFFAEDHVYEFYPSTSSLVLSYLSENVAWIISLLLTCFIFVLYELFGLNQLKSLQNKLSLASTSVDRDHQSSQRIHSSDLLTSSLNMADELVTRSREESSHHDQLLTAQRDLLHGVAHELRSPLARIEFALELLMGAGEEQKTDLRKSVDDAVKDLDELVKEILSYSRLQQGDTAINRSLIDIPQLTQASVDIVKGPYSDIEFRTSIEPVVYSGDANLLKRALVNLLRNAGRFATSICEVSIINGRIQNTSGLIIFVNDDGNGIPPGKRERIFEPFTRLDPSRSRDSGGCGLGLAIVTSIVAKHGGTIAVDDSPLGGARFQLFLPNEGTGPFNA